MRYLIIGLKRRPFVFWRYRFAVLGTSNDYDTIIRTFRLLCKYEPWRSPRLYESRFVGVYAGDAKEAVP